MELDDMKAAWQAVNARLERAEAVQHVFGRERIADRLRHGLRPLIWGQALQALLGLLFALWGGSFWVGHRGDPAAVVCGVSVHAFGLMVLVLSIRTIWLACAIDMAAPVAGLQQRLARLRFWRVWIEAPLNGVVACFVWIPVLWMSLARYGVASWSPGVVRWAVSSSLVGLFACVVALGFILATRRGAWLQDHFAGRSVRRAQQALDELVAFERE